MGQGATASTSKKTAFSLEWSFIIYTHEYIENTADKGVCQSIHCHYIDDYYGRRDTDFLFVACPGRNTCWSWSPTLLQTHSETFHVRLGFVSLLACGGLCLLALAPGGGPLLGSFLFQHGPVKCVVILVVQCPEEDAEQLA